MELEVVTQPETKAEQEKAANEFQEQIKQDPNYSTGSIEEFGPSFGSGDDIDWNQQSTWGDNVVIH